MTQKSNETLTNVNLFSVMGMNEAYNAAVAFKLCRQGLAMIARSEVSLSAPKATAREWLATFGREMPALKKIAIITQCKAYNYERKNNNELAKIGENPNFEAAAPNGCEWVVFPVIKRSLKSGELLVTISFTESDKSTAECRYIVGDRLATEDEAQFIRAHLRKKTYSVKQAEHGITDPKEQIQVRNYKLANVLTIDTINKVKEVWAGLTA